MNNIDKVFESEPRVVVINSKFQFLWKGVCMSRRTERVGTLIQREISNCIITEIADPRFEFFTINSVKVATDLRNATVYYSIFGTIEEREAAQKALKKATGFIQRYVVERLQLRFAPELYFKYDETIEKARSIDSLLDSVLEEEKKLQDIKKEDHEDKIDDEE